MILLVAQYDLIMAKFLKLPFEFNNGGSAEIRTESCAKRVELLGGFLWGRYRPIQLRKRN